MAAVRVQRARQVVGELLHETGFAVDFGEVVLRKSDWPNAWMDAQLGPEPILGFTVGMVESLDREELAGVMLHEVGELYRCAKHRRSVDRAKRQAKRHGWSAEKRQNLLDHLDQEKEFACDEFALEHGANPAKLASSLQSVTARKRIMRERRPDLYGAPIERSAYPSNNSRVARFQAEVRAQSL